MKLLRPVWVLWTIMTKNEWSVGGEILNMETRESVQSIEGT